MKILYLLFIFLFLSGCSYTDDIPPYNSYSDGVVRQLEINSWIIDVEKEQINTKEELFAYFDSVKSESNIFSNRFSNYLYISISGEIDTSVYEYVVYVKPLNKGKPVLDEKLYNLGMPVTTKTVIGWLDIDWSNIDLSNPWAYNYARYLITGYDYLYSSNQQILIIKGHPEWADSSYEYNGEKFTVLPVCDSDESNIEKLRFDYTVEKVEKK